LDFEATRLENNTKLLPQIDALRSGEDINVLVQFAKAYLGMFYVIDSAIPAEEKINLLVNEELAGAILQGFVAYTSKNTLPSVQDIGQNLAENKDYNEGYIVLAGMDLIAKKSLADVSALPVTLLNSVIGFYYANKCSHQHAWYEYLLENHTEIVAKAVSQLWQAMVKNNAAYLPGRKFLFGEKPDKTIVQFSILPLLENWTGCKPKILFQMLLLALKHSELEQLQRVCEKRLAEETLNERSRLYLLTTVYLIAPEKYQAVLTNYVGRVKLKVMPMLDFIVQLLTIKNELKVKFNDVEVTQLLKMVAPVFPPQHHVYGALGSLDINSRNVMLLFYYLVQSNDADIVNVIKSLRKARVMKIYSGVIDNLLEIHLRKKNENEYKVPDFNAYVETLVNENKLQGKSNKFDLH